MLQSEVPPPPVPGLAVKDEDPPWTGWDVALIALVAISSTFFFIFATAFVAQRMWYRGMPFVKVLQFPLVVVAAQVLAYIVVLAFMFGTVELARGHNFLESVRWNWPRHWGVYLASGVVMAFALQGVAHFLPMPKDLPIDKFFQTPAQAWALSLFGVLLAPLMEELFFRGFLYPVLTRRLGIVLSVGITSISFALIHAQQLASAWAPLFVILLVALALTITRAVTKSLAAPLLLHMGYNFALSGLLFVASGGFQHLDRLGQ